MAGAGGGTGVAQSACRGSDARQTSGPGAGRGWGHARVPRGAMPSTEADRIMMMDYDRNKFSSGRVPISRP